MRFRRKKNHAPEDGREDTPAGAALLITAVIFIVFMLLEGCGHNPETVITGLSRLFILL